MGELLTLKVKDKFMKKLFGNVKAKNFLQFCIFGVIIFLLFNKITWIFRGNSLLDRENIVYFNSEEKDIDVIFYGGSNVLCFYQPMLAWNLCGYTSYNYAVNASKPDMFLEYIRESRKTQEPQLYVIDIRALPLIVNDVEELAVRNWADSIDVLNINRFRAITKFIFNRDHDELDIPSYYVDIMKYHSELESLADPDHWKFLNKKNIHDIDNGYFTSDAIIAFDTPPIVYDETELSDYQEETLNSLLDYCDKEQLPVLFIANPYKISAADWRILNKAGKIIEERGYDFINFNYYYKEIGLDFESDFSDPNHTNQLGAEKYTIYLSKYLAEKYNLPDHRQDSSYRRWNEEFMDYLLYENQHIEQVEKIKEEVVSGKETGKKLPLITDFGMWYEQTQNSQFSLLIVKDNTEEYMSDAFMLNIFLKDKKILDNQKYCGIWSWEGEEFIGYEGGEYVGNFGHERGLSDYVLCSEPTASIAINGVEYAVPGEGIHVVVYNNTYRKVIDSILVDISEAGQVVIRR